MPIFVALKLIYRYLFPYSKLEYHPYLAVKSYETQVYLQFCLQQNIFNVKNLTLQ
jgi:hypothetical protein